MAPPIRVASFVPAGTEWMYALGLQDRLVGITFACDVPRRAKSENPILIHSEYEEDFDTLTAGEIHALTSRMTREHAHTLFAVDTEALAKARPDVILAQEVCEVCAASDPHLEVAAQVLGDDVLTVGLGATRLDEVWEDGRAIAEAAAAPGEEDRVTPYEARVARVRDAVADRPWPRVAYLEWTDPPMTAGHWIPDVITAAGAHDVLGEAGGKSRVTDWNAVSDADPDVLLVGPCGFDRRRAAAEARAVKQRFPGKRVIALDANRYLSRGGPNLATSVELIAHLLHPDVMPEDPDPTAWAVPHAEAVEDRQPEHHAS